MKGFMKDYAELLRANGRFYKNHWKGSIVMILGSYIVGCAGTAAWFYRDEIKKKIESKFRKEDEEP